MNTHPDDQRIQFLYAAYLRKTGILQKSSDLVMNIQIEDGLFGRYSDYISYYKADVLIAYEAHRIRNIESSRNFSPMSMFWRGI